MLLCIALVAALGVQAFAIIDEETPSQKDTLTAQITAETTAAAKQTADAVKYDRVATFFNELEKIGKAYKKEVDAATTPAAKAEIKGKYDEQIAVLGADNKDLAKFINDTGAFTNIAAAVKAVGSDYDWDYTKIEAGALATNGETYYDDEIVTAISSANDRYADAANHTEKAAELQVSLDVILAAEAEKAAAEKLEKAALKAAQAAVKDPKTSAEWMAYWAAYDKVYADKALSAAKTSASDAKDSVATAQKAAVAQAKLAVENAQIEAYNNMTTEINKAVNEYVSGVWTALGEFYADLYA